MPFEENLGRNEPQPESVTFLSNRTQTMPYPENVHNSFMMDGHWQEYNDSSFAKP